MNARRDALRRAGGLVAGAMLGLDMRPAAAQEPVKFSTGTDKPKLSAPPGSTDCHFHIYDNRFPPAPGGLPAADALPADYRALQARIGTTRGVVVQPSLFGTDNRPTLEGMKTLGPNFRAVAVVNTSVTDEELKRMHGLGVRGIRFNLVQIGATSLDMLEPLSQRVDAMGWHCQVHMAGAKIVDAADTFMRVKGRLVFDHLGHCNQTGGVDGETFKVMRKLIDKGNTWVKLSGLYMDPKVGPPTYADTVAIAQAFAKAAPNRMVWGSDWPHPTEKLDNKPNDALLFDLLGTCVPDEATRKRVLVDNPAELYDFPKA
jgi:predicted TIM-barrel fold metal-dependent hydrolase